MPLLHRRVGSRSNRDSVLLDGFSMHMYNRYSADGLIPGGQRVLFSRRTRFHVGALTANIPFVSIRSVTESAVRFKRAWDATKTEWPEECPFLLNVQLFEFSEMNKSLPKSARAVTFEIEYGSRMDLISHILKKFQLLRCEGFPF